MRARAKHDRSMQLLVEGCTLLGLRVSLEQERQFASYLAELSLFNEKLKLVAAAGEELVIRHVLDCVAAVDLFRTELDAMGRNNAVIGDFGSGSGMPGILLAILLENVRFELVERSARRCGFLLNAIAMCNLSSRVGVSQKDLSELKGTYDIITFRAFRPLVEIFGLLDSLAGPDSRILAYKGRFEAVEEELLSIRPLLQGRWISSIVPIHVPFLDASRHVLVLRRETEIHLEG